MDRNIELRARLEPGIPVGWHGHEIIEPALAIQHQVDHSRQLDRRIVGADAAVPAPRKQHLGRLPVVEEERTRPLRGQPAPAVGGWIVAEVGQVFIITKNTSNPNPPGDLHTRTHE